MKVSNIFMKAEAVSSLNQVVEIPDGNVGDRNHQNFMSSFLPVDLSMA